MARWIVGSPDELFGEEVVHTFDLTLDLDTRAGTSEPASTARPSSEFVDGELEFDGEHVGPIGVRSRPASGDDECTDPARAFNKRGRSLCGEADLRLRFNWAGNDDLFFGVRRVELHSLRTDPSMMRERLTSWVFRQIGVRAPRTTHARVVLNGEDLGLFALVETVDAEFARRNFADGSGNLYRDVWPFDDTGRPTSRADLAAGLVNPAEEPDVEIAAGFAEEFAAAQTPEAVDDILRKWTDPDSLVRIVEVDRAVRNDRGALFWPCPDKVTCAPSNFVWYEDPSERKVFLIPEGFADAMDAVVGGPSVGAVEVADAFGAVTNGCKPFANGRLQLMQRSAACDPLLGALASKVSERRRIAEELRNGPLSDDAVQRQLQAWDQLLAPYIDQPALGPWRQATQNLRADLAASVAASG